MRALLVIALCAFAPSSAFADDGTYSADAYANCAACHLPDGVGVPGAFPPIRNRSAAMAELDGGREYLVVVTAYGLMGNIQVDGVPYFGVMAGLAGALSDGDIAAALNYLVFELNDGDTASIAPFTAEEVASVRESVTAKSPTGGGQLREKLVAQHGDSWP